MLSTPQFLHGVFPFSGKGLDKPRLIDDSMAFTVPSGHLAQPLYFRGGHTGSSLVTVTLVRDGTTMRIFPMAAQGAVNIPLRVVEDVDPDTRLELHVAAPKGCSGEVVIDFGLVLI
ncbi:hypothetical protein [Hoyosella subflava]|uniref:Molybdopterin oxidoreductase n=1 Tax=Hoyosella subflava (strain DSM 45089 / JCM 17490 / NBRC 109087 / DQS3-9A1) TaxID=443218 RepID=F6EEC4_HOYSD|nr:hypothetical protein [Hoyosella subflava]AEF38576.1 hypothetical protein AS9A_0116 [Hoyosella subflava DQS3-9A1]